MAASWSCLSIFDITGTIGALIIRIGFGRVYYTIMITRNPQNSTGSY